MFDDKPYDFYYDETYQCRAITYKDGHTNVEKDGSEFYAGCFIGSTQWDEMIPLLMNLENQYKQSQGMSADNELKSNHLVKPKNCQYGIASLPKYTIDFYSELFRILSGKVKIHFNVLSKYQAIVAAVFPCSDWFNRNGYHYRAFLSSMTKFIANYQDDYDILSVFYSYKNDNWKVKQLIKKLEDHAASIAHIRKKSTELKAVQDFVTILSDDTFYLRTLDKRIPWDYDNVALTFANYCESICLPVGSVTIDREERTFLSVKKFFPDAVEADSNDCIQVRVCDWIVGFVGRLMAAYSGQLKIDDANLTEQLNLLDSNCFVMDDAHKQFVLQLYDFLLVQQESYWATTTSAYADYVPIFYSFIRYCQLCLSNDTVMNPESFNVMLCQEYDALAGGTDVSCPCYDKRSTPSGGAMWCYENMSADFDGGFLAMEQFIKTYPHDNWSLSICDTNTDEIAEIICPVDDMPQIVSYLYHLEHACPMTAIYEDVLRKSYVVCMNCTRGRLSLPGKYVASNGSLHEV